MFSRLRKRFTYANVAMTLALVFAMSGGAYAASKYAITSSKQIKPSVLKQLRGAQGPTGTTGAAGVAGAAGPQGPAGARGETGPEGKAGKDGTNGTEGQPGEPGRNVVAEAASNGECSAGGTKFEVEGSGHTEHVCNGSGGGGGGGGTLASGQTETGTWFIEGTVKAKEELVEQPISFTTPLAKPATAGQAAQFEYVEQTYPNPVGTAHCPGSYENPTAEPGYFCVYAFVFKENVGNAELLNLEDIAESAYASRFGAILRLESSAAGTVRSFGAWAVTAK